MLKIYFW